MEYIGRNLNIISAMQEKVRVTESRVLPVILLIFIMGAGLAGCGQTPAQGHGGQVLAHKAEESNRPVTFQYEELRYNETRQAVSLAQNRTNGSADIPYNNTYWGDSAQSVFERADSDQVYVFYNGVPFRLLRTVDPIGVSALRIKQVPEVLIHNYSELSLAELRTAVRRAAGEDDGTAGIWFNESDWERINASILGDYHKNRRNISGVYVRYNKELYRIEVSIPG